MHARHAFWYRSNSRAGLKNPFQRIFWSCFLFLFIDAKTMTVKENWTSLVQSLLYLPCTRMVRLSLTVIVFASIKTKHYTHVSFLLPYILYHSLHEIRTKKPADRQTFVIKRSILNHLKLERAPCSFYCVSAVLNTILIKLTQLEL